MCHFMGCNVFVPLYFSILCLFVYVAVSQCFYCCETIYTMGESAIYTPRSFAIMAFSLARDGRTEDDRLPFVGSFVSFCKGGFYGIIS